MSIFTLLLITVVPNTIGQAVVGEGVFVLVGVLVCVGVLVVVGVAVDVFVFVGVFVLVGVLVGVEVLVAVGVGVGIIGDTRLHNISTVVLLSSPHQIVVSYGL
jgi:hypothetical protein